MSQYGCVVPVDWTAVCFTVLPRWIEVLNADRTAKDFASHFGLEDLEYLFERSQVPFPLDYLTDIGWQNTDVPLATSRVRKSKVHRSAHALGCTEIGTYLLGDAIVAHASVSLGGHDAFASQPWDGYYSRLGRAPHVQVAGTKNRFYFLEAFFDISEELVAEDFPESTRPAYPYHRKTSGGGRWEELLEFLFLGLRTFPGVEVLPVAPAWPASDDVWIAGYLVPEEVRELASLLGQIVGSVSMAADGDELFPLFEDRVGRAATDGTGLIAFHGFLF
jgi:hypothetical protein